MKLKALSNSAFLIFDVMISCSQGGGGGGWLIRGALGT